jgi:hypothetical protein
MIRLLTVVSAAALLAACSAPEVAPVAPAAAVSPATASRTASTAPRPTSQPTQPLGVVPVDMGSTAAQEIAAGAARQAGNPPGSSATPRQAAPKPAPVVQPALKPAPMPAAQPAPKPAAQPAPEPAPQLAAQPAPQPSPQQPASGCNANYTPCVPDDSDVDCAGGSGNGPSYVHGPVQVIGSDVYGLDSDDDGIGCEAGAAAS